MTADQPEQDRRKGAPAGDGDHRSPDFSRDSDAQTQYLAADETRVHQPSDAADPSRTYAYDRNSSNDTRVYPPTTTGYAAGASDDASYTPATQVDDGRRGLLYDLQMARMANKATTDVGLLILRLSTLIMVLHGIKKATGYAGFVDGLREHAFGRIAPDVFGFLIVAGQLVLPVLIAVGLFTRLSALALAAMMASSYALYIVPTAPIIDPRTGGLSGESALLYVALALPLFFTGAGRFSLDHLISASGRRRRATKRMERDSVKFG